MKFNGVRNAMGEAVGRSWEELLGLEVGMVLRYSKFARRALLGVEYTPLPMEAVWVDNIPLVIGAILVTSLLEPFESGANVLGRTGSVMCAVLLETG